jgi:hypothetical protein
VQKCGEERAKKCVSYTALWALLRDHPKFSQKNKKESSQPNDDDDFESSTSQGSSVEAGDKDDGVVYAFGEGDKDESENEQEMDDDADADEDGDDEEESGGSVESRGSQRASARASPRASPTSKGRGNKTKSSPSPKAGKKRAKRGEKRKTFVLKKPNDTMSHADITRNYLHTRDMQTSAYFAISLLRERRITFFECINSNMREPSEIQDAFNLIGLGTVPDFFHEYMVDVGRNAADAVAEEGGEH